MKGIGAVFAAILATGCASGIGRPVHEVKAVTGSDQVQRVTVTTHSFYFEPNRIVVTRGIPVELTVKNGATFVPHDFSCGATEAGIEVDQGVGLFREKEMVRFTPTKTGEYTFVCDKKGHAAKGMKGTLVVVDP